MEAEVHANGADRTSDPNPDEPYLRLADLFHQVLAEHRLEPLLERIADALADLIPYDTLTIYEAKESDGLLVPVLARDEWADEILQSVCYFGEGITGWAAERREAVRTNDATSHPRVAVVPGTPKEPEALVTVPLVARGLLKGALNIYRQGPEASFTDAEFDLAKRFGDAVGLAMDNAQSMVALERASHNDSLTGLYNHRFFHERLRAELTRVSRLRDSVALLVLDIDDFKKINDMYGHGFGDRILIALADLIKETIRGSDIACRLGGEEFVVIMPSCDAGAALGLAHRIAHRVGQTEFPPLDAITVSIGIAQGPDHAMNPRDLLTCADSALLNAKARGKDRVVLFDEESVEIPVNTDKNVGDIRSIAHLKLIQSLSGKLNRLSDVQQIASTICLELRSLIDYHSCVVHLTDGERLVPVAARGELARVFRSDPDKLERAMGEGLTGHVASTGRSILLENAQESVFAAKQVGTPFLEESVLAVPLSYGALTIGVVMVSQLGVGQFDNDDVRLLEVLAGHASVALENARLYEAQQREAQDARALLEFSDAMSRAADFYAIGQATVEMAARLLDATQSSLWLENERTGHFECASHVGYGGDPTSEPIVRTTVGRDAGQAFIAQRTAPFLLSPEEGEQFWETPAGVISRTLAIAPLHGVSGWITVRHPLSMGLGFTDRRLELLAGLSFQASVAMQKALAYKDQKESAEIATALLEFGRDLAGASGLDEVLSMVAEGAARTMGSPKTSVWMQDADSNDLACRGWWGYEGRDVYIIESFRLAAPVAELFLASDGPFIMTPEMIKLIESPPAPDTNLTYAVVPLRFEGSRAGAIAVGAPAYGEYQFSERKIRLLSGIGYQAMLAINNAASFENLERTFLSTVEALANALEAKDEYTSDHARWITDVSLEVGRHLGLPVEVLKRLELGALFHDIGKIGIPHAILLKPGPLDEEEWAIIKTHPELGEKILGPIDRLSDVRPIVRHCHEHYDGSGYPDALAGDAIPIESRIILVVDAYHAMTSDRSYRKALPMEVACGRLKADSGIQFDPQVVEAFLAVIRENPDLAVA